ncbi:hypothetical protein SeLEV6574_g04346 [Synchytrium endobioticum]|uniref:Uncharacterized protein n=1 Tax=Synchytrium endobioticum TaxID=286115 RepID=A0A507CZS8_9FUNG|nr:hypothetical protein SeLEV6574_g04346 [Synchytrium endobioticum]
MANDVAALDQTAVPLDIETNTGILPATIPAPFDIANNTPIELIAGHNLASYVVANIWSRDDAVQILHQFQIPHVHTDIIADHDDDEDDALPTSLRITPELARRMLTSFIAEAYERCLRKYRETLSDGNVPSSSNAARMYNLALEYCRDYATIGYLAYLKLSSNAGSKVPRYKYYPEYKLGDDNAGRQLSMQITPERMQHAGGIERYTTPILKKRGFVGAAIFGCWQHYSIPSITSWSIHDLQLDLRLCAASELGLAVGRLEKSNTEPHLTDKAVCGTEQQQLFRKKAPEPPRKTWASTITKISADLVAIESYLYSLLPNINVVPVIPDKMLSFWGISNRQPSKVSKSNSGSSENDEDHEVVGVGRGKAFNYPMGCMIFKTQRKRNDLADAALYAFCLLEWQVNALRLKREVDLG